MPASTLRMALFNFYSRPCGRGDFGGHGNDSVCKLISTHAPAGGATGSGRTGTDAGNYFYSRPCGRGDVVPVAANRPAQYFYSRPCGRGDTLRKRKTWCRKSISTHAPAGGATADVPVPPVSRLYFYSRPCGRGDFCPAARRLRTCSFLLTPLREGRQQFSTSPS